MKSTAELVAQANLFMPDNNTRQIQPSGTRESDKEIAESSYNKITDKLLVGLREHEVSREYDTGEACIKNGIIYQANQTTQGIFNTNAWDVITNGVGSQITLGTPNGLVLVGNELSLQLATGSQNGALSFIDWVIFNNKQDALGFTPENIVNKGLANGYVPLNSSAKIDTSFLPDSITGALNYKGTWNASTNTPVLSDVAGAKGEYYVVSVAGSQDLGSGTISFNQNDWVVHNGTNFEKLENLSTGVQSVQGLTGSSINLGAGNEDEGVSWAFGNLLKSNGVKHFGNQGKIGLGGFINGTYLITLGDILNGIQKTSEGVYENVINLVVNGLVHFSAKDSTTSGAQLVLPQSTTINKNLEIKHIAGAKPSILLNNLGTYTGNENGSLWASPSGIFYRHNGTNYNLLPSGGGSGIPIIGASTDKGIATWNGTGGNNLQSSNVVIDDDNIFFNAGKGIANYSNGSALKIGTKGLEITSGVDSHLVLIPATDTALTENETIVNTTSSLYFKKSGVLYDLLISQNDRDIIANALIHSDVVDNLNSSSIDVPLSANQGRILQNQISSLGDIKIVADNTERDSLTGLSVGDIIHVEDGGAGTWVRWQITEITNGDFTTSTKLIIATETVAGGTNLSYVSATRTIESNTGSDAILPIVVSGGDAGLMSGSDKSKLDGIETGATADMTPSEILEAIKTVDGSGSGLDADTIDGYNSSGFVKQFSTSLDAIDLNDIKISGSYRVNIGCSNMPINSYLSMIVVGNMTNTLSQRVTEFQTGETWVRTFNVSWSAWRRVFDNKNLSFQKTLVLESPIGTDDILLMELDKAITITKVTHQIFGATNVSFNINHGATDLWATDKVATTTKVSETVFTDNTVTANSQIRYQASAITGTPTKIEITLTYTED